MTTESKKRANPDYSASAEKLTQSPFIKHMLDDYHQRQAEAERLNGILQAYPEYQELQQVQDDASAIRKKIEESLPEHGGFQDIENGHYALRQKAISVTYQLDKVRAVLPAEIAARVIVESVDKAKVEVLIHNKIISGAQADEISDSKTIYRNIIK